MKGLLTERDESFVESKIDSLKNKQLLAESLLVAYLKMNFTKLFLTKSATFLGWMWLNFVENGKNLNMHLSQKQDGYS